MTRWMVGAWLCLALCACGRSSRNETFADAAPFFRRIDPIPEQVAQAASIDGAELSVAVVAVTADGKCAVGTSRLSVAGIDTIDVWEAPFRWTAETGTVALGNLSGDTATGSPTRTLAMTPDGSVLVGGTSTGRAYRWTESEGMVDVTPAGVSIASARLVSDDGDVVVGSADSHVFRWTKRSGAVLLDALPNHLGAYPFAMSRDGSVVAGMSGLGSGVPFQWTARTGTVSAGTLSDCDDYLVEDTWPPASYGRLMVGTCSRPGGAVHGFFWSEKTGLERIDFGPETTDSWPHAVSPDGSMAVGFARTEAGVASLARWTRSSGASETVQSGAEFHSRGLGLWTMSTDGSVVVGDDGQRGFQWSSETGPAWLEPLPMHDVASVSGVSGDGRTIAGVSYSTFPDTEAVVWISGEPTRVADVLAENDLRLDGIGTLSAALTGRNGSSLYGNGKVSDNVGAGWVAWLP